MFFSSRNGGLHALAGSADGPDYWDDLDAAHTRHRRALIALAAIAVGLLVLGIALGPAPIWMALAVLLFVPLQLVGLRQTRSHTKIPDYRHRDGGMDPDSQGTTQRDR